MFKMQKLLMSPTEITTTTSTAVLGAVGFVGLFMAYKLNRELRASEIDRDRLASMLRESEARSEKKAELPVIPEDE